MFPLYFPPYSRYSTVQYSTVQYSTLQYSTVQYSTVQYSRSSAGNYSTLLLYSKVQGGNSSALSSTMILELVWFIESVCLPSMGPDEEHLTLQWMISYTS